MTGSAHTQFDARASETARWLLDQHRTRARFTALPADRTPGDVAAAYRAQDAFVAGKAARAGAPAGWKIALSNPAMQRFVGLDAPIAGRLLAGQLHQEPARVRAADYGRLLVEFEIAVWLGADLPERNPPWSAQTVEPAVLAVAPAIELADDRDADYATLNLHGLQLIADNAWSEGAVIGSWREDWRELDLDALEGRVTIDDEVVGTGHGRDLMGHPLAALAWLANHACARGTPMRAGDVAILGSMITSRFPRSGQRIEFALDGFLPIELYVD